MNLHLLVCLLLLAYCCKAAINTTEFWRKSLNLTEELHFQAFSGFQEIDWYHPRGKTGMHYQLFGAMGCSLNESAPKVPLILWLNGGPGSSSLFGAFAQNGPIRIVNGTSVLFKYSWSLMGHMLFVDQPLNVGFSYDFGGKHPNSSSEAATHLLNFLYNFYQEWPQLAVSPLYIAGESFAGHYIPPFAREILRNATFQAATGCLLKGVALGDGWVDPANQLNYYDSLLYSIGVVSNKFRDVCQWMQTQGLLNIYTQNYVNATAYFDFLTNNGSVFQNYLGGMNDMNFRQYTYGDSSYASFLQKNKDVFGVPKNINFNRFNGQVYEDFHQDISTSYSQDLVAVMREVRVMIYNGQEDYVVTTAGVLNYLNSLQWQGLTGWKRARKQVWRINNEISGWAKTWENLWFVLVNKAGHLVPTDNPQAAFNMMGHFLRNDGNWSQ